MTPQAQKIITTLGTLALTALLTISCSTTRTLQEGDYLLKSNKISTDPQTPRRERITAGELDRYVLQSPNRRFLGTNLYTWLWAQADPKKENGWNNFLRGAGEQPVIWEPAKTTRSTENLRTYIASRGFFSGSADARVDTLRRQKVKISYAVRQGPPSHIGQIKYTFRDTLLRDIVMADSSATLLHRGDIFDTGVMDDERIRITSNLRNRGYYNFNVGHITYIADSVGSGGPSGRGTIDLEMVIRRNLDGYTEDGTPIYADHRVYRLGQIFVHSDYDPLADAATARRLDTLQAHNLNIVYDGRQQVWARLLRRAVDLYSDSLYSASSVEATSAELMRLGAFRSVSVLFNPVPGTDLLNCDIRCVPALRQSFSFDLEGSTTSRFYGLRPTLGYQNRNAFRGAELLSASLTGGFEFIKPGDQRTDNRKLSYELGATVSLSFPRFVFWAAESNRKIKTPLSTLSLSANWQDRAFYSRTLFGLNWGYSWRMRRFENFTLRPVDISLVRMGYLDPTFKEWLNNPYLVSSYNDQLIAGISASYVYNDQPRSLTGNATVLRVNAETTGNMFSGLVRLVGTRPVAGGDHYNIFGIQFSQYVRGDVSFSQRFMLGEKTAFAYRVQAGAIYSYGNSSSISPPSDKQFFAGGVNSMRGWAVRTLGPGTVPYEKKSGYPVQMGDVKMEANVEFRFPVMRQVGGALFFDAGNIWFMRSKPTEYPDTAVFRLRSFYRQLGLDGGIGARVDVGVVVLRLDWGIQLHTPGRPAGERWIRDFRWDNTALSFGVGYPF
ncbi:MAG: BamA/TamA family outer membrane protein [Alistipes sp.]|jgi:outer membrane protein assembly factor BamA|nr:BamA/TamA family outer membrane protein [Alistipes sp.]